MAISSGVNTRAGCRRIAEFAFDYAVRNKRRKRSRVVHKANVLKALTGVFLETGARGGRRNTRASCKSTSGSSTRAPCSSCSNPWQFDVIVTTNLFGDILSDEIAGLVGGLGMAPGANIGPKAAIFEAVHGSAPDIAGKGIANPLALLLAACLMLDHVGKSAIANQIRRAVDRTLRDDGVRTRDLGGKATTRDFTNAVIGRLVRLATPCVAGLGNP